MIDAVQNLPSNLDLEHTNDGWNKRPGLKNQSMGHSFDCGGLWFCFFKLVGFKPIYRLLFINSGNALRCINNFARRARSFCRQPSQELPSAPLWTEGRGELLRNTPVLPAATTGLSEHSKALLYRALGCGG